MKVKPYKGMCTVESWSQVYVTPVCFSFEFFYITVALLQSSLVQYSAADSLSLCDRVDTKRVAGIMCLVQAACTNNVQEVCYYSAFFGYSKYKVKNNKNNKSCTVHVLKD